MQHTHLSFFLSPSPFQKVTIFKFPADPNCAFCAFPLLGKFDSVIFQFSENCNFSLSLIFQRLSKWILSYSSTWFRDIPVVNFLDILVPLARGHTKTHLIVISARGPGTDQPHAFASCDVWEAPVLGKNGRLPS